MSPSQRLLLQHTAQVVHGVLDPGMGVYVGSCHHDFERLQVTKTIPSSPYNVTGTASSVLAG